MQWAEPVAMGDHPSDSGTELEFGERVVTSGGFPQFSPGGKVCVSVCMCVCVSWILELSNIAVVMEMKGKTCNSAHLSYFWFFTML